MTGKEVRLIDAIMRDFVKTNKIPMNDDAFYEAIADKFNNLTPNKWKKK